MEYFTYQNDKFRCLLPDFCKVKSEAPDLAVVSKNQRKRKAFFTLLLNPDESTIEAQQLSISSIQIADDEHREQNELRRGTFQGKWEGTELFWEILWLHNREHEYGWWLHLIVNGNDVCVQLAFDGDLPENGAIWTRVFDSIEIE